MTGTTKRREAFIAYLQALREDGVVTRERTAGENAAAVGTAAMRDFAAVGLAPVRSGLASLLEEAAARVRGKVPR